MHNEHFTMHNEQQTMNSFIQNKANLLVTQMNISSVNTINYEQ
jgi:hypothetical protein